MPAIEQVEETIAVALRDHGIHAAAEAVMLLFGPQSESDARNGRMIDRLAETRGRPADLVAAIEVERDITTLPGMT